MAAQDAVALIRTAQGLQKASAAGSRLLPLRGKNLALLRLSHSASTPSVLHGAALALGIRVAVVRLDEPVAPGESAFREFARMLGRLYDAVDCDTPWPPLVRRLDADAGILVYDGLDSETHPSRALADLMTLAEQRNADERGARIAVAGDTRWLRDARIALAARTLGIGWEPSEAGAPIDAARSASNHSFILQALLIGSLSRH